MGKNRKEEVRPQRRGKRETPVTKAGGERKKKRKGNRDTSREN